MNKMKSMFKSKSFLITILCLLFGIVIALTSLIPNDYWWHVKAGEYIYQNKKIPFIDVFSWYGIENNLYWHSHEWLSEIVIYLVSLIGGYKSVFIFTTICTCGLLLLLYKTNKFYYEKYFGFTLFWVLIGSLIFGTFISPRPHMISFILFTLTIWILYFYRQNEDSKTIWFLPLITIAWVNFHGGSSNLPYILTSIFIITGLIDFNIGKLKFDKLSKKQLKTYFIIMITCFIVVIINPHGIDMIMYPYSNMGDKTMLNYIGEWRSPDLKNFLDIKFISPIVIGFLVFLNTRREISFIDLTLFIAFSYLTLKSIRFSTFLYIVLSYIIFKYLDGFKVKKNINKIVIDIINTFPEALRKLYFICIGSLSVFVILIFTTNPIKERFETDIIENEIIETIKEVNPERLYNDYNYGGYLIYNNIKPLIDGRADMYSDTLLKDFIEYSKHLNPELKTRYDFDYYLVDKNLTLDNSFKLQPDKYEKLIEDKRCVLYKSLDYKTKPFIQK